MRESKYIIVFSYNGGKKQEWDLMAITRSDAKEKFIKSNMAKIVEANGFEIFSVEKA